MTNEKLEFANMLKKQIDRLDREIYLLMELCPPVRSTNRLEKWARGWARRIRGKNLIWNKPGLKEQEIELSNEDIRTLTDIRTAEREALKQVLEELG